MILKVGVIASFILVAMLSGAFQSWSLIETEEDSKLISNLNLKENPSKWDGDVVTIRVLVVGDEEFRRYMNIFGRGWRTEAFAIVEGADDAFYRDYGINFMVAEFLEWNSDDQERDGRWLLVDAQRATGWSSGRKSQDIIVVFTGQRINGFAGWAEHYSGSPEANAVIVQHQFDFGRGGNDRHVLQEELSHLFGAPDHVSPDDPIYWREDIMSYKWLYYTDKWDVSCREIIERNKYRFSRAS